MPLTVSTVNSKSLRNSQEQAELRGRSPGVVDFKEYTGSNEDNPFMINIQDQMPATETPESKERPRSRIREPCALSSPKHSEPEFQYPNQSSIENEQTPNNAHYELDATLGDLSQSQGTLRK